MIVHYTILCDIWKITYSVSLLLYDDKLINYAEFKVPSWQPYQCVPYTFDVIHLPLI